MPKLKANNSFSRKFTSNFGWQKKMRVKNTENLCKEHYRDMTQKKEKEKKIKEKKNHIKI